jgi:hypothetical protein
MVGLIGDRIDRLSLAKLGYRMPSLGYSESRWSLVKRWGKSPVSDAYEEVPRNRRGQYRDANGKSAASSKQTEAKRSRA